ncbi:ABC transporter permease [Staphylococcus kloosii]|jgi:putative ABC transport system permease protein|uniref:ABC transporter permease n=1 Tax=Staphylococcus kloosii TaxID=29384 RepID=UPI0018A0FB75|nr:ABC transporter permease [Staphylococcus kloosii]MBF7025526.1 ABC transporter permease [Staphylococcus kloosii]
MKNISNIVITSIKAILKNKRRNIFTMIGIIIGISAVITIMSLGNGFKKIATDEFSKSGISKDSALIAYFTESGEISKKNPFTQQDIDIAKQVDGVTEAKIKIDDKQSFTVKATNIMNNEEPNIDLSVATKKKIEKTVEGKGFSTLDNNLRKKVVVVNDEIAHGTFEGDAIGRTLYIDGQGFKIVGVFNDPLHPANVFMPIKTFEHYMSNLTQDYPALQLTLAEGVQKKDAAKKVADELNKNGSGIGIGKYSYEDNEKILKEITQIFDSITYFVAAVAGISLFIAGIGVMNVMYISVSERTEEIAIRRAFGAKARDIEFQFLIESIILCVIGGLIGLALGIAIAEIVAAVTPEYIQSVVSLTSILIAVGVSTFIGIIFGWVPARSAANKELIDIIK